MIKRTALLLALAAACSFTACESPGNGNEEELKDPDYAVLDRVTYGGDSDEIFLNPERGWYNLNGFFFRGSVPSPLTKNAVVQKRNEGYSIIHCIYYPSDFRTKALSQSVLDLFAANMNALREGGSKCILRFAYDNSNMDTNNLSISDAPVDVALGHIAQLKPLFQEHGDVILAVEAGFIGTWGEWYYTSNYNFQASTVAQYEPRRRILDALLDAVPGDRMVCVRTARHKMLSYGLSYADSVTLQTAHDGSKMSRLAAHNDCFLASADDYGTYSGGKADMLFWEKETRYVMMGGETCNVNTTYTNCTSTIQQMERYHWTYLNRGYHGDVLNGWKTGNCYDEVQRRLGYRLVLKEGYFTPSPSLSAKYEAALKIENTGFAAPVNPRGVEIVFVDASDASKTYAVQVDDDPRFWFAGETHTVHAKFDLPKGMAVGKKYNVWLNLPDPKPRLKNRPEYSIRLANKDIWNSSTGFNKIHEIQL